MEDLAKTTPHMPAVPTQSDDLMPVIDYNKALATMTDEQRQGYLKISENLTVGHLDTINMYGADLSETISKNSGMMMCKVKATNGNELIKIVNEITLQMKNVDIGEIESYNSGFKKFMRKVPILRELMKQVDKLDVKYKSIVSKIEEIKKQMERTKMLLMEDNGSLEVMYAEDRSYMQQCQELIIAGRLYIDELNQKIEEMQEHPENYQYFEIKDTILFRDSMEKRVADLEITRHIVFEDIIAVRSQLNSNHVLITNCDSVIRHKLPIWNKLIMSSFFTENQKAASNALDIMAEGTNEMIVKNMKNLHETTVNIARQSEKSIVDINAIKMATKELLDMDNNMARIHDEGVRNRANQESIINSLNAQLQNALLR